MTRESSATPESQRAAVLAANEVFVCRASGEGSHNFRVCETAEEVDAFYKEMWGEDQGGGIQSHIDHFRDEDNWSNQCTAYHCDLYCSTFEVWKVDRTEVAAPRSESAPKEPAVLVPIATLEKWGEALSPYTTEGSYNNDGVIDTIAEMATFATKGHGHG